MPRLAPCSTMSAPAAPARLEDCARRLRNGVLVDDDDHDVDLPDHALDGLHDLVPGTEGGDHRTHHWEDRLDVFPAGSGPAHRA